MPARAFVPDGVRAGLDEELSGVAGGRQHALDIGSRVEPTSVGIAERADRSVRQLFEPLLVLDQLGLSSGLVEDRSTVKVRRRVVTDFHSEIGKASEGRVAKEEPALSPQLRQIHAESSGQLIRETDPSVVRKVGDHPHQVSN